MELPFTVEVPSIGSSLKADDQRQLLQSAQLEARIIELLTSTRLTFKQIVNRLQADKLSASIGLIRRINRDNRFRRPRYDSKLTREQRALLLDELVRQCAGGTMRPNLSQLAKKFGVCHGSIWYWWDKLNKITTGERASAKSSATARNSKRSADRSSKLAAKQEQMRQILDFSLDSSDTLASMSTIESPGRASAPSLDRFKSYKLVGRVEVCLKGCQQRMASNQGCELYSLPIVMLTRLEPGIESKKNERHNHSRLLK